MASLEQASVVILARNFNPTIASKEWLLAKKIISGPVANFVHVPNLSMVEAQGATLILDESRLQLTSRQPEAPSLAKLAAASRRFVRALPHTPYTALGFNLRFAMSTARLDLGALGQPKARSLARIFGDNCHVGYKITFLHEGFRVTVDIPPLTNGSEPARVALNFHADVASADEAIERISRQGEVLAKAENIMRGVAPDG
jgi:hypothetical protein